MKYLAESISAALIAIGLSWSCGAGAAEGLTVRPKPPQAIEVGEAIPISISVGATAATNVSAGTVNLNLKGNGRSIAPNGLKLCKTSEPCADKALSLEANKTHSLWLHGAAQEGVYEGTVAIDSAGDSSGATVLATTIYLSSTKAKVVGVLLIAVSVFFAFCFTVVLRHTTNRKSLLIPPAVTRAAIYALQARLNGLGMPMRKAADPTSKHLDGLLNALDVSSLERNGLPTTWATPLSDSSLAAYKAYVSAQSLKVQNVKVVIEEGLYEIEALLQRSTTFQQADVDKSIADVQSAGRYTSTLPPTEEIVRQGVQAAVKTLAASDAAKNLGAAEWAPAGRGADSAQQLQLQVANINRAMWVVVLLLTTGVGAAVLVLTGPAAASFGTVEDLVRCVMWGLGLSAGAQLTSASTSTVTAAFGVPKQL